MVDRDGLLDLAGVIQLKAEVIAKQGDVKTAAAYFDVAELFREMADDPSIPLLAASIPSGYSRQLAEFAVALVTGHITVGEYIEAASAFLSRPIAEERAKCLKHIMTATA